jgi:hypothetical protein
LFVNKRTKRYVTRLRNLAVSAAATRIKSHYLNP